MKTIYQVENAKELFDGLCKTRLQGDVSPSLSGTLKIECNKVAFDGNVDVSRLSVADVLKEAANRLGLEDIKLGASVVHRGGEFIK